MKVNVYSMRDKLSGYLQPTFEQSDDIAIRNFSFAINKKDTLLFAAAKHFDLYKLGTFDTETGIIEKLDNPQLIIEGLSCKHVDEVNESENS